MRPIFLLLALVGSTALAFQTENERRTEIIHTSEGPVVGRIKNEMRQFLGVPYATPPIGDLRWRPPQPHASWTEPFEAFAFGKACAQNVTLYGFAALSENEDCLFLNVFAPVQQTRSFKRPVMLWIHGGGLFNGASNDYDPSKLVQEGQVIFVSMNYRLNVFGFIAHPALDNEGDEAGNYGIMDQQLALKWVRQNIEAFRGRSRRRFVVALEQHLQFTGRKWQLGRKVHGYHSVSAAIESLAARGIPCGLAPTSVETCRLPPGPWRKCVALHLGWVEMAARLSPRGLSRL
jgi:hypothetical protein